MKLLLVEDDERLSGFIKRGLTEEGHTVVVRDNGVDAEDQIFFEEYDVAILDIMLPGQSGFEVLRHARAAGITVPVLMLTARDGVADRVRGLDAGADDYLTKPFAFEELLARLRALERRGAGRTANVIQCGPLSLDLARRSATCQGAEISLTHTEYALLEYLCRNAGRLLSRAQIEQQVWGDEYERDSNVVEVYINYLRKKLTACRAAGLIETVRGSGYRLRGGE